MIAGQKRAVVERKAYLINELANMGHAIDLNRPISEFNLVELEQKYINEKCKIGRYL